MSPGNDESRPAGGGQSSSVAQNRPQRTTLVRQSPAATRVRQVVCLDLSDVVGAHGELDYTEARARLCRLAAEVQPGQAVVLDLGDADWAMLGVFRHVAEYLAEAGAVQVEGAHGAFVAKVAEQLEAALR